MIGSAECPYCNCLVSEDFVIFGGDLLHRRCFDQISADLEDFGDPVEPVFSVNGVLEQAVEFDCAKI